VRRSGGSLGGELRLGCASTPDFQAVLLIGGRAADTYRVAVREIIKSCDDDSSSRARDS
jgi:hypothetical protein